MKPTDERAGLVSASKFEIVAACEGYPALEAHLRDHGIISGDEAPDEWAQRGTRIHKAFETGDTSDLAEDEIQDWESLKKLDAGLFSQWLIDKSLTEVAGQRTSEKRLWLHNERLEPITSGQYDRLYIAGNHALVIDAKTGFCKRLTPSQESWQLRLLAVLVWQEHGARVGLESVRVAFLKPKFGRNGIDMAEYSIDDLYRSMTAIKQILWRASQSDVRRSPGDHCYYCPCRAHCREAASFSLLPSVVSGISNPKVAKRDGEAMVSMMTPADWKFVWERSTTIRNILAAVNDNLKKLPPDALASLGLKIQEGRRLDPITNTIGAYKALEHSLPPELLWRCLSFSKGELSEAYKEHKGCSKKDADAWVKETIAPFVEEKRADGSLGATD